MFGASARGEISEPARVSKQPSVSQTTLVYHTLPTILLKSTSIHDISNLNCSFFGFSQIFIDEGEVKSQNQKEREVMRRAKISHMNLSALES